jgi:hypothetical protein
MISVPTQTRESALREAKEPADCRIPIRTGVASRPSDAADAQTAQQGANAELTPLKPKEALDAKASGGLFEPIRTGVAY